MRRERTRATRPIYATCLNERATQLLPHTTSAMPVPRMEFNRSGRKATNLENPSAEFSRQVKRVACDQLALGGFAMLFIRRMSLLLFFIDGLGIGTPGPHNPFDELMGAEPLAVFQNEQPALPFAGMLRPTDACLGVAGRPQSASGQTTILTGINAPAAVGYHKQGFPNQALRDIIHEHSIFVQLKRDTV